MSPNRKLFRVSADVPRSRAPTSGSRQIFGGVGYIVWDSGGVTRSGKALVSQCVPEALSGVTFRQKVLRYQRTAQSVLNRDDQGVQCRYFRIRPVINRRGSVPHQPVAGSGNSRSAPEHCGLSM
jgi:hypothetical protein